MNDAAREGPLRERWLPLLAAGWYVALYVLAFPPFHQAWGVLFFLMPFVAWAGRAPRWRTFLGVGFLAAWLAWALVLIWLRFIYPPWGWVAMAALSATLAMFPLMWLAALRWAAPRIVRASGGRALLGMFGLAGLWVVFEWVRTWLFTGFPWLPLAAAFWRWPMFLQLAAWTGQWGVSWLIVLFNLGLVFSRLRGQPWQGLPWRAQCREILRHPDVWVVVALIYGAVLVSLARVTTEPVNAGPPYHFALVQPWTPALLKWDEASFNDNIKVMDDLTLGFRNEKVDAIVWPEVALPVGFAGPGTERDRAGLATLVDALGKPLIMGALETTGNSVSDYNAMMIVEPKTGFTPEVYEKRKRVPFGEYVPLRDWLPFAGKVVPMVGDAPPGRRADPLPLTMPNGKTYQLGALICYEDIFPALARDEARRGADFFVVVTNDAWYGEEGGALQHAAHSVLRAIETGRPIIRCGNDGWSGEIDANGYAHPLEKDAVTGTVTEDEHNDGGGTTYFRGAGVVTLPRPPDHVLGQTFYVRFGDWFVGLSAALVVAAGVRLRRVKAEPKL